MTHLSAIFPKMLERLRKTGRGAWLDQEMERLADPANYANDPELAWQRVKVPSRKPEVLGRDGSLVADLLKLLLKIRARDIDVASRLLARSDELEALAAGTRTGLPMLEGWRYEQFGRDAVDLVEGRLAFAVTGGKLKMTRTEEGIA